MSRLILYFQESEIQRCLSDCVDMQAGLCLSWLYVAKSDFLRMRTILLLIQDSHLKGTATLKASESEMQALIKPCSLRSDNK